jgi:transposase
MRSRQISLHHKTKKKLHELKREAEKDGALKVAKRLHAVILNDQGKTSTDVSQLLDVSRSSVSLWLKNFEEEGIESLFEGYRPGRTPGLTDQDLELLRDIVESGPVSYGFNSGVWNSKMIAHVIEKEFLLSYHPGHVRKILYGIGCSVQRPKRALINADPQKQKKWVRYTYPSIKKKPMR